MRGFLLDSVLFEATVLSLSLLVRRFRLPRHNRGQNRGMVFASVSPRRGEPRGAPGKTAGYKKLEEFRAGVPLLAKTF